MAETEHTPDVPADPYRIVIHHVGGIGGYGPVEALGALGHVEWIVFDAREESLTSAELPPGPYQLVRKGIGGADSEDAELNVSAATSSSSLFKPAPEARDYTLVLPNGRARVWGPHSRTTETISVKLRTIDGLIGSDEVPPADFLSIDAQGAELSILNGASGVLRDRVVGVICEVEFAQLYEGQPLFCDIQDRLRKDGFRFCEIYGSQYLITGPVDRNVQGKGFLTVGEALFLREKREWSGPDGDFVSPQSVTRLLKLAAVAVAFDQLDYAIGICQRLERSVSLDALSQETDVKYISMLRDLLKASETDRGPKRLLEEGEGAYQTEPSSGRIVIATSSFLLSQTIRAFGRKVARAATGRAPDVAYPPIGKILYRYGFKELAFKNAARAPGVPYVQSGVASGLLDTMSRLMARIVD